MLPQDAFSSISRSQDLTVTWSGGDVGGYVAVFSSSANPKTGAGASFQCAARADAGSFTVPAWVLSALPASGIDPSVGAPVESLSLGTTLPQPSRFQATGIDVGFFTWAALQVKNVIFQLRGKPREFRRFILANCERIGKSASLELEEWPSG